MMQGYDVSYNERLFRGGVRRWLHMARFEWARGAIDRHGLAATSVLELGCFDGKLLDSLDRTPRRYLGLDANWEGGLDLGRLRQRGASHEFRNCRAPAEMRLGGEAFDLCVAMEVLEHVPPALVEPYLDALCAATTGCLIVTVPNEIGPVFTAKYLTKRVLGGDFGDYSLAELVNQTLGRTGLVRRHQHKGFDWRWVVELIERRCQIVELSGHPFSKLPPGLNFGVGIVARPQRRPVMKLAA